MAIIRADKSRAFVRGARFPEPPATPTARPRSRAGSRAELIEEAPPVELKDTQAQALVVGSSLIAAAENVPADVRKDLVNCTLFAQLAASGSVADPTNVIEWYRVYFSALATLGWAQNGTNFREYKKGGSNFETHQSIIKVLALALGPQVAAVTLITETLNALQSMEKDSPWIKLFDQQSASTKTARFQVATAQYAGSGLLEIALVAFDLRAKAKLTQVLFFKARSSSISLKYADGTATIYEETLAQNRADVAARLEEYRKSFIREVRLAPLPPPPAPNRSRPRASSRGVRGNSGRAL
jgi:hypothetical protein